VSDTRVDWVVILLALLGSGIAIVVLVAWALWLRRRLPASKALHHLPWVMILTLLVPVAVGLRLLVSQLLSLFQALHHVRPVDRNALQRLALAETADQLKTVGLFLAVLSLSCLVVLTTVTWIEWRLLFRPPPSGR